MDRKINTGIIGFGMAGTVFHAPFIHSLPEFELRKISTSRDAAEEKAYALYPEVEVVRDPASLIGDRDIDLVIVATPNASHFPLAKAALLAGKHVIVEKPFTVTSAEAQELAALARKQGKILSVNHNRLWDSDFLTVQKVLHSGFLGNLVEYAAHFDRFRPVLKQHAWREEAVPGAGILYDLGAHLFSQAILLFGLPREITAEVYIQRPGARVDDTFNIVLQYPGCRVNLQAGMLVKENGPHFILHGHKGSFVKYGMDVQEAALKAGTLPVTENWGQEPENIWGTLDVLDAAGLAMKACVKSEAGNYNAYFKNVAAAIQGQEKLLIDGNFGAKVILLIELALQSSRKKEPFRLKCRNNTVVSDLRLRCKEDTAYTVYGLCQSLTPNAES